MDFAPKKWKWAITQDREQVRIEHEENRALWHKKTKNQNLRHMSTKKEEVLNQIESQGFAGKISDSCDAVVHRKETVENTRTESSANDKEEISKYPIEAEEAILNRRVIAAADASADDRHMSAH